MTSIFKRQETEGNNDEQDSLLMHVPAKQKRGIATKRYGRNKCLPGRLEEELNEADLQQVRSKLAQTQQGYLPSERTTLVQR